MIPPFSLNAVRRTSLAPLFSVIILTALASIGELQATIRTWDGDTDNVITTAANWSDETLPNISGDTALWNGTQEGDLSLTWTGAWTITSTDNPGVNIQVASTQKDSLTMTGNTNIGIASLTVESGAGAVNIGVGSGSFVMVFRGGSTLTNNSSNTVTFGSNVTSWQNGNAIPRNVIFGGSGNWQIDGNYTNASGGSGNNDLTKNGAGTLTFNGSENGAGSGGGAHALTTITINQGKVKFGGSSQLRSTTTGVYFSTITNDGILEWASSANQSLTGEISGSGALIQSGAGTLTLTRNNTYTGSTTVSAGRLVVTGTLAGSTLVSGGVLAGTGAIKAVTLQSGAISPGTEGSPIGTLKAVSLTLEETASSFDFDLSASNNTSDRITLTNAFNKGERIYTFNFTGGMDSQAYTLITFNSTNFSDVSQFVATGVAGTFALQASSLTFTTIPEPSTAALVIVAPFAVLFFRSRLKSI